MAIHVAEEARHISFADQLLAKRVPQMVRRSRFALSLYVPIVMRVLCQAIIVPPRSFFWKFNVPRSVRKDVFFGAPESREALRDMYGDVRMLCDERRFDESLSAVGLAHVQDRWSAVALPRRTSAR